MESDNISYGKPSAGLNPLKASQLPDDAKIRTDVEITKNSIYRIDVLYLPHENNSID